MCVCFPIHVFTSYDCCVCLIYLVFELTICVGVSHSTTVFTMLTVDLSALFTKPPKKMDVFSYPPDFFNLGD